MKEYIYIVTAMECDWEYYPISIGVFSTVNLAIDWLNKNKTIISVEKDDTSLVEWVTERGSRKVFHAYGYDYANDEVKQDDDGYFVWYDEHNYESKYKYYLTTRVSYTIECFEVDRGV